MRQVAYRIANQKDVASLTGLDLGQFRGRVYAGVSEGRTIFLCGVEPLLPGVGEAWIVLVPDIHRYIRFYHVVRRLMEYEENRMGLVRLQAHCDEDRPENLRFIAHLGFTPEAVLRKRGLNGKNQYICARVKED